MNEIVKYHNELNAVPFKRFNAREMNLFFSIVSRLRDKGTTTVRFRFNELRELSNYTDTSVQRFMNDLETTYDKMMVLTIGSRSKLNIRKFVLFTGFEISGEHGYVDIRLNPDLKDILNELDTWTRFSLQQFNSLHSTYAKTLFRLLKQYRTTGRLEISMNDFKELLEIPKSYKVGQIDQKVLKPSLKELSSLFYNLSVEKIKSRERGNRVLGYVFTFQKEDRNADDFVRMETEGEPYESMDLVNYSTRKEQEKNQHHDDGQTYTDDFYKLLKETRESRQKK